MIDVILMKTRCVPNIEQPPPFGDGCFKEKAIGWWAILSLYELLVFLQWSLLG